MPTENCGRCRSRDVRRSSFSSNANTCCATMPKRPCGSPTSRRPARANCSSSRWWATRRPTTRRPRGGSTCSTPSSSPSRTNGEVPSLPRGVPLSGTTACASVPRAHAAIARARVRPGLHRPQVATIVSYGGTRRRSISIGKTRSGCANSVFWPPTTACKRPTKGPASMRSGRADARDCCCAARCPRSTCQR